MLRLLLILLLVYFVWKVVVIFIRRARYRAEHGKPQQKIESFDHIEDAEFKDITNEPPEQ
jgi:hypothetical protein